MEHGAERPDGLGQGPAVRGQAGRRRRRDLDEVEWLFWVGCAGAYEDRAKKTTRAVAELLHEAGCRFAVLGDGETCTGDPARRSGNEFVFQQLAMQNAEVLKETKAKKVVATCAHCFNTLKNEYSPVRRRARGRPPHPAAQPAGARRPAHPGGAGRRLGRAAARSPTTTRATSAGTTRSTSRRASCSPSSPAPRFTEMPRNRERSFCCGAGGARMWMEEKIGERINLNRTSEAVAHRRRPDRGRLPVLPGDALRRPDLPAGRRQGRATRSRCSTSPSCCSPSVRRRRPTALRLTQIGRTGARRRLMASATTGVGRLTSTSVASARPADVTSVAIARSRPQPADSIYGL